MLNAILYIGAIGLVLGLAIGIASKYLEVKVPPMVQTVYDMLPHFNCGACGTPGCMAMANEVVNNGYPVTKCKPGTDQMKREIQKLLDDYKSGKLTFDEK